MGTIRWQDVGDIMGPERFFGPEDWNKHFRVEWSEEDLDRIPLFSWSEEILESLQIVRDRKVKVKETHLAFLGLPALGSARPLSILGLAEANPGPLGISISDEHKAHPFTNNEYCQFQWYLASLYYWSSSHDFWYNGKGATYDIPTAIELVTMNVLASLVDVNFIKARATRSDGYYWHQNVTLTSLARRIWGRQWNEWGQEVERTGRVVLDLSRTGQIYVGPIFESKLVISEHGFERILAPSFWGNPQTYVGYPAFRIPGR